MLRFAAQVPIDWQLPDARHPAMGLDGRGYDHEGQVVVAWRPALRDGRNAEELLLACQGPDLPGERVPGDNGGARWRSLVTPSDVEPFLLLEFELSRPLAPFLGVSEDGSPVALALCLAPEVWFAESTTDDAADPSRDARSTTRPWRRLGALFWGLACLALIFGAVWLLRSS